MSDDRKCLGPPRCRYTSDEGIKAHEPGCPMLLPPPVVRPDPMRYRNPVAIVTGAPLDGDTASGADLSLHGLPAAVGVEIPLTHRIGDYMAQPRTPMTLAEAGLPPSIVAWHEGLRDQAAKMDIVHDVPFGQPRMWLADVVLLQPDEQRLIDDIKKGETAGDLRKAIDRFMASVYDAQIDALAAKRREHTKRLIK